MKKLYPRIPALVLLSLMTVTPLEAAYGFGAKPVEPKPTPAPAPTPAPTPAPVPVPVPPSTLSVENLENNQRITAENVNLFKITTSADVDGVKVLLNGALLGSAEYRSDEKKFRYSTGFAKSGEFDLSFVGFAGSTQKVSKVFRINVVPKEVPPPAVPTTPYFNQYILKAVDQINKKYAMLGYNINAQLTHDLAYHNLGTLKATKGSLTMCVSAVLEVIVTAYDIYAKETGDYSIYQFLPFESWNTLKKTAIKAHIWVDAELNSYGTADALIKFGMGERAKFEELEPGAFINLNRTNKTGHAVVFISYIDEKGNELPRYSSAVAGFKYYSAQGKEAVGQGGFGYKYAFFDGKCPTVPYPRDCGVMRSSSSKYLNTGFMLHPKHWKAVSTQNFVSVPPTEEDRELAGRASRFNGLTTDD